MNDCLFCKFVTDTKSVQKVYEDEHVLAFLDINPVNPGHTLLLPKNHSRNILEINEKDLAHIMAVLPKVARAVKEGVKADGINIHINNEGAAGQVILHTHIHIIPRFSDDGIRMWHGKSYEEGEMEQVSKNIISNIQ